MSDTALDVIILISSICIILAIGLIGYIIGWNVATRNEPR
jgi:hypothetical protein